MNKGDEALVKSIRALRAFEREQGVSAGKLRIIGDLRAKFPRVLASRLPDDRQCAITVDEVAK